MELTISWLQEVKPVQGAYLFPGHPGGIDIASVEDRGTDASYFYLALPPPKREQTARVQGFLSVLVLGILQLRRGSQILFGQKF